MRVKIVYINADYVNYAKYVIVSIVSIFIYQGLMTIIN